MYTISSGLIFYWFKNDSFFISTFSAMIDWFYILEYAPTFISCINILLKIWTDLFNFIFSIKTEFLTLQPVSI